MSEVKAGRRFSRGDQPRDSVRDLGPKFSREQIDLFKRMPASFEAMVEGQEGPIELPPEQAETLHLAIFMHLRWVQQLAFAIDEVNRRLDELESRLASE